VTTWYVMTWCARSARCWSSLCWRW